MSIETSPVFEAEFEKEQPKECDGYLLTEEFLAQIEVFYDHVYRRHLNGGGYVEENSYVPDELHVSPEIRIGPNTRLLDDKNIFGQRVISGNYINAGLVSREMTDEDYALLAEQDARRYGDISPSEYQQL